MASLFNIMKITVDEKKLRARVLVNPGMPLMTSEDIEATARVYYLAPAIAKHVCLGDAGREFQDCMGNTELAHLLEHLTVEILNETGLAGDISCGRTRGIAGDERLFEIELSCPDDVLTIGALSSAAFMMEWAFLHADATAPDFAGTVEALRQMTLALRGEAGAEDAEAAAEVEGAEAEAGADADAADAEPAGEADGENGGVIDTDDAPADAPAADEGREDAEQPIFGGAAATDR